MSEPIRAAFNLIDGFLEKARKKSAKIRRPVTCCKGCFYCCKEPVMAEKSEVRALVETITDPGERELLTQKTKAWWFEFFNRGFDLAPPMAQRIGSKDLMKYRAASLWCPLLRDGLCTAYSMRPIPCRLHNATGPARDCEDDSRRHRQMFMTTDRDADAMKAALGEMCQNAPQALFEFDHLGVWLGHHLLGETRNSQAFQQIVIRQTDPK